MTLQRAREAIRTTCQNKGWSVLDLARKSEVSPEAIRRFVSSRGEISSRVLYRLFKALGIDPSKLR